MHSNVKPVNMVSMVSISWTDEREKGECGRRVRVQMIRGMK